MDKEELKKMANNPDFIPGIFNYCDRWCERCPFTSQCFLFATEKKPFADDERRDVNNERFWEAMEDMFALTVELLEETADELGIDLDEINTEEAKRSETEKHETAQRHPSAQRAKQYIGQVNDWFEAAEPVFNEKGEELVQMAMLDLPEEKVSEKVTALQNYVEIIRWYQHQICVKIMRALQGQMHDFAPEDPVQNDHNGSVKVALIGVDRSIAAWGGLLQLFPEKEDSILGPLITLEKIRKQVDNEFPKARQFKRPGFDD